MNRLATFAGYSGFVLLGWNAVLVPALIRSIQPDFRQVCGMRRANTRVIQ